MRILVAGWHGQVALALSAAAASSAGTQKLTMAIMSRTTPAATNPMNTGTAAETSDHADRAPARIDATR